MALSATVVGSGESFNDPAGEDPVSVSDPFQVADCSSLQFAPKFAVSTSGKTSKSEGASLTAKVSYPPNAVGTEAWLASAKVELPTGAAEPANHVAEGLHVQAVRSQPGGVPTGICDRPRDRAHPDPARTVGRTRLFREPRRRSLPQPRDRPAGLWRHDQARGRHVHQQSWHHVLDVRFDTGRTV